mmetsp:Transcript_9745/g.28128  ORF Transcript_9745/g.28128 Transcript_9745/m.28128 type:complete len:239 (-) Transcript_9745:295-1011(-)
MPPSLRTSSLSRLRSASHLSSSNFLFFSSRSSKTSPNTRSIASACGSPRESKTKRPHKTHFSSTTDPLRLKLLFLLDRFSKCPSLRAASFSLVFRRRTPAVVSSPVHHLQLANRQKNKPTVLACIDLSSFQRTPSLAFATRPPSVLQSLSSARRTSLSPKNFFHPSHFLPLLLLLSLAKLSLKVCTRTRPFSRSLTLLVSDNLSLTVPRESPRLAPEMDTRIHTFEDPKRCVPVTLNR